MSNKPKNLGGGTVILGGGNGVRKVLRAKRKAQARPGGTRNKPQGLGGGPPVL